LKVQNINLAGDFVLPAISVLGFSFLQVKFGCLQESFGNGHLLFMVIARVSFFSFIHLQKLLRDVFAGVLAKLFCKPSLFGCLGLPAR